MAQLPAGFEQRARGIQVHAHAKVEVSLGLPADHGGQVEHGAGIGIHRAGQHGRVGEVAGDHAHARIVDLRRYHVQQRQAVDRDGLAVEVKAAALEQQAGQLQAEEAGAAGNQYIHGCSSVV
ncbi:hypothetical protein D3C86_1713690 [compost metagenome]